MLDKLVEKDERVILTSKMFGCSERNPIWGSNLACVGTIRVVEGGIKDPIIKVDWDNGKNNSYRRSHLDYYFNLPEDNPNVSFLKRNKKIRGRKK